jgi:hypothetical protein
MHSVRTSLLSGLAASLALVALVAGCEEEAPVGPGAEAGDGPVAPASRSWHVPDDHPTIAAALAAASAADTIIVAPGTYHEHGLHVDRGLTIRSEGSTGEPVVVDAGGQGRVMTLASAGAVVTARGLTITGGRLGADPRSGAGLFCTGDSVRVEDCVIRDNHAPRGHGGGLHASSHGHLVMVGCTFADNTSDGSGGGAEVRGSGAVTVRDCEFRGNGTPNHDAAGLRVGGPAVVEHGVFTAQRGSAAVFGDSTLVRQTVFRDNQGTALSLSGGGLVEDCTFTGNRTLYDGAAIVAGSNVELRRSVFLRNLSEGGSGAVHGFGSELAVRDCDFIGNACTGDGGAIGVEEAAIDGSRFFGNVAGGDGGAVAARDLVAVDCDFRDNHAAAGGAVQADRAELGGCTVVRNTGREGVVQIRSALTLTRSTLAGNRLLAGGGVIQLGPVNVGEACTLEHTLIAFNDGVPLSDPSEGFDDLLVRATGLFGNAGGDWVGPLAGMGQTGGNLAADPLFCDLARGDVSLCADSPCLPPAAGDQVIGARDAGCVACGETP